jgi:hypothetical protein
LFAVRRGNDLQHDWIEVRVIEGFDPRLVAAARSRTKRCNLQWFVAHIVTTPTSREEAADIGKAFCNAGTVPVYRSWQKKCADGGPFEWFTDDGGDIEGRVWLKPATSATT